MKKVLLIVFIMLLGISNLVGCKKKIKKENVKIETRSEKKKNVKEKEQEKENVRETPSSKEKKKSKKEQKKEVEKEEVSEENNKSTTNARGFDSSIMEHEKKPPIRPLPEGVDKIPTVKSDAITIEELYEKFGIEKE